MPSKTRCFSRALRQRMTSAGRMLNSTSETWVYSIHRVRQQDTEAPIRGRSTERDVKCPTSIPALSWSTSSGAAGSMVART